MPMKRDQEHFRGCLLGGAIGDALGLPVEFLQYSAIKSRFGEAGITDLVCGAAGLAQITDDTQMTLFTAEGIIRSKAGNCNEGACHLPTAVYQAYQRWLVTQGYPEHEEYEGIYDGWLFGIKDLHARRGPGITCLSALESRIMGDMENPINRSKGCGGVMRVAPAGLAFEKKKAFVLGAEFAAITHGHPSGYLAAGALAYIIAAIIEGSAIDRAVENSIEELTDYGGHEECTGALKQALKLAAGDLPDIEAIKNLGEGWVGEEALAIAVYCSLKYRENFSKALIASVNHSGDSDSTGAITGNIMGAYLGMSNIPADWLEKIELKKVIIKLADDLLIFQSPAGRS